MAGLDAASYGELPPVQRAAMRRGVVALVEALTMLGYLGDA